MDKHAWETCRDASLLLEHWAPGSDRKLRLLAVAWCRLLEDCLIDETRKLIDVAEGVAEGQIAGTLRKLARQQAIDAGWHPDPVTAHARGSAKAAVSWSLAKSPAKAAAEALAYVRFALQQYYWNIREGSTSADYEDAGVAASKTIEGVLREIVPNPCREVLITPQTQAVLSVAGQIYETREFDKMPILADAMEEAGCDDEEILDHCRRPTVHFRGCWVLDLILAKD